MALRAGYYGIKRGLKAKLIEIAGVWDETVSSIFPRDEQAVLGAVNLFASFVSESKSGMTFTVDANGVVDVDGQPSANYVNIRSVFKLKKGAYTVSGVPSGFGTNKMLIALYDMNNVQIAIDNGSGATFTLNADTQLQGYIYVYQAYGDFDHVKVYPMINLGTDARPFVPYAMTNKELTEKVQGIINAATNASDFAAFKTAMGGITLVTRSLSREASPEDVPVEVIEEEKPATKKTTKKTTVKEGE